MDEYILVDDPRETDADAENFAAFCIEYSNAAWTALAARATS